MGIRKKMKVAVGQAGGPTAVFNASLYGFVSEACDRFEVFGIVNGFQGLVDNQLAPFDEPLVRELRRFRDVPGAFLGSGRWTLTGSDMVRAIDNLKKRDIHCLVFIGGNGTMWCCRELERTARECGYELSVIGIPKTVDNDLHETDHSPGFASAARYIALSVRDIGKDLQAMRNFESVRIIETMGRNVGWLSAAGALLKETGEQPPHLVYTPEKPLVLRSFLSDVTETVKAIGYAAVVVSEGVRDEQGNAISRLSLNGDAHRQVLGGASAYLSAVVARETGLASRAEILGMNQRCSQWTVAAQDRLEAEKLGIRAAERAAAGESGTMLTLLSRTEHPEPYSFAIGSCPLDKVAGLERPLPQQFFRTQGGQPTEAYKQWLRRIVGSDIRGYPDGIAFQRKIAR